MTASDIPSLQNPALDLPPYTLDVESLDLGSDVKAVGLELIETESREPLRGAVAAEIWASVFAALVAAEPAAIDFFSHIDRVREFCKARGIAFREAASRCLVLSDVSESTLRQVFDRFEKETFGIRAGAATQGPDATLEQDLSHRGLDAYQAAYTRYTFCAICEPEDGWVTLLSASLWPTEVMRRIRPAVQKFDVYLARPH
jgi:hypothetical protein